MQIYKCKICSTTIGNQPIVVREMMFGFRDEFLYFNCSSCGCLQIVNIPQDLAKYYPADKYLPHKKNNANYKIKNIIKQLIICGYFNGVVPLNFKYLQSIIWLSLLKKIQKPTSILDIGCGIGNLLNDMASWGFNNLTGIDPFIENDISYPSRAKIYKKNIFEYTEKHDLIMMHHSFEHMDNPYEVLKKCYHLLTPGGKLLIRIPVADCFAYRKYGPNWYQLDAPRHFFLHTTRSISMLAKKTGFTTKQIEYDSNIYQFIYSEQYCKDITLYENVKIPSARIKVLNKQARKLNLLHDGDQAIFYFIKK